MNEYLISVGIAWFIFFFLLERERNLLRFITNGLAAFLWPLVVIIMIVQIINKLRKLK